MFIDSPSGFFRKAVYISISCFLVLLLALGCSDYLRFMVTVRKSIPFLLFFICAVFFCINRIKTSLRNILFLAFISRLLMLFLWNLEPVSDFADTLAQAKKMNLMPPSEWANITPYYSVIFSSIVPYIRYESIFTAIFPNQYIWALQLANVLYSTASCGCIYLISKKVFSDRVAVFAASVQAVNPFVLLFISVLSCQHLATFLFLAGISTMLGCFSHDNLYIEYIGGGVLLGLSNLIRGEMIIVLIAFACILVFRLICQFAEHGEKRRILSILLSALMFFSAYAIVNDGAALILKYRGYVLSQDDRTVYQYKFLVGLNQEADGRWNYEDATLLSDCFDSELNEDAKEELRSLVHDRINNLNVDFIIKKLNKILSNYTDPFSFSSLSAEYDAQKQEFLSVLCRSYMFPVSILAIVGVLSFSESKYSFRSLFITVIILGYILIFALIEVQSRYAQITVPLLSILSGSGFDALDSIFKKEE